MKFSIYISFFFSFHWLCFFYKHLSIFFVKFPWEFLCFPKTRSFQSGRTDYVVKTIAYRDFLTGRLWTTNSVFQMAVGVSVLFLLGVCFSTLFLFCFCFPLHICLVFLTTSIIMLHFIPVVSCAPFTLSASVQQALCRVKFVVIHAIVVYHLISAESLSLFCIYSVVLMKTKPLMDSQSFFPKTSTWGHILPSKHHNNWVLLVLCPVFWNQPCNWEFSFVTVLCFII